MSFFFVAQHTYEIIGCLKVFPDSPEFFFFLSLSLVKCKDLWWEKVERKFHIFGPVGQRLFFLLETNVFCMFKRSIPIKDACRSREKR
jgi:hypothetical protein